MNIVKREIVGVVVCLLFSTAIQSLAIDGLGIALQNTNVVISWPSLGYERFLIQSRPTLDPSTPWSNLTNNYPANSTNRTTHTIYGVVSPPGGGGSSMAASGPGVSWNGPMVMQKDEKSSTVPLDIYPAGFDLSGYIIIWPDGSTEEWTREFAEKYAASKDQENHGPQPEISGGGSGPDCEFFRVFLVPDFWYDYTQYEFTDGVEFMPVYLGVDAELVADAQLLVDGQAFPHAEFALEQFDFGTLGNPDIQWTHGLWVYHDRLPNGVHQFQLRTSLQLDNTLGGETPYLTMTAPAFSTSVSNLISFNVWNDTLVGTNPAFSARSVVFPATWDIDIYDVALDWVTTLSGVTSDGNISTTWDFRDGNGSLRDDLDFDPFFVPMVTVAATGGGSPESRWAPTTVTDYPKLGGWVFAYQDSDKATPQTRATISAAALALAGGPGGLGIPNYFQPMAYGHDVHTNPATAQALRNYGWYQFANYFFNPAWNNRNLYYMGHGTEFRIGGDFDYVTNGVIVASQVNPEGYIVGTNVIVSKAYMPPQAVRNGLTYNAQNGPRRYRFAFLDGCATAYGEFPNAFGIGRATNSLAEYLSPSNVWGFRPSAFVGWNEPMGYTISLGQRFGEWGDYQQYANFRTEWMTEWSVQNRELLQSLVNAQGSSGWISLQTFARLMRVYGYQQLRFNEFNRREDWQWPPP